MRVKTPASIALFVVLAGPFASAAEPPRAADPSPEGVVRAAMTALKDDRLEDFAKAMHPRELRKFKDLIMTAARSAERDKKGEQVLAIFKGIDSVAELDLLDDNKFFASFLRGVTQLRPELKTALGGAEVKIIGRVAEGEDLMHVVCRMTMTVQGITVAKVEAISLRKNGTGWGMILSMEIEAMAALLKNQFGGSK